MSAIANRRDKDRKKRAKLRKRLEAAGVDSEQIERIITLRREDDRARRHRQERERTRDEILQAHLASHKPLNHKPNGH